MPFLKNVWYCAGWDYELEDEKLVGRKLVGEFVMLYRKQNGKAVAVSNVCPHRFAPMNEGKRIGDDVACPYHGLVFGPDGKCTKNPYSDTIAKACNLKSYPLEERWKALWIWMGDPNKADPSLIPDFSTTVPREGWDAVYGHHETDADYQLVVDNLLDRTHVQCMHPLLIQGIDGKKPNNYEEHQSMKVEGDVVWDFHQQLNCPPFKLLPMLWPGAPELTEHQFNVRWEAPGNMLLDSSVTEMGTDRNVGSIMPMANLVTPADENTTHYFWNQARNSNLNNPEIDEKIKMGVGHTFKNEDGAMVAACQRQMGTNDLMSLNPVLLPADAAAMRARRIMMEKIAKEQKEGV